MDTLESRLAAVEAKLDWLMSRMRMRAMTNTGILDAKGQPEIRVIEGNLHDHYRMSLEQATSDTLVKQ